MSTEAKKPAPVGATIEEKLTQDELSDLRAIRRAGMAIRSCSEILTEHYTNEDCIPVAPSVFIQLRGYQAFDLQYAIEACANRITGLFDKSFDDIGLEDDFLAGVAEEAQLHAKMRSGEISVEEFSTAVGVGSAS